MQLCPAAGAAEAEEEAEGAAAARWGGPARAAPRRGRLSWSPYPGESYELASVHTNLLL